MKAVTFLSPRHVACREVPEPRVQQPDEVVVQVEYAGLCGSDLHVYRGHDVGLDGGTILGHELVGRVVEAGDDVTIAAPGDRIVSAFSTSCGVCPACAVGLTSRCERGQLLGWRQDGRGLHGAQAERVVIPLADTTLLRVPDGLSSKLALLAGDVLATGMFGADAARVEEASTVAVVGCGAVGLMAVAACRERGARRVFAVDLLAQRRRLAVRFGAEDAGDDPLALVAEATAGRGVDAVVEAVGHPDASRLAYGLVRIGGTIAVLGVHTEAGFAFGPGEVYDKNLTYVAGRCPARRWMGEALALLGARRYPLGDVVSATARLEDAADAYATFDQRVDGCTKIVFMPAT